MSSECRRVAIWMPYFFSSSSVSFFGSGAGVAEHVMSVTRPRGLGDSLQLAGKDSLRRFLFQTAFGSGAAAGRPPFTANLGIESRLPVPVFAISRGRLADRLEVEVCAVRPVMVVLLSPILDREGLDDPFAARN